MEIAVIGAGPAGLTCALALQKHGIDVTVYDADASLDARDEGGTLDLHADSGQIALEDVGLLAEFTELARPESQANRRLDHHGTVLKEFVPTGDDNAAPEIDRGQLRALLASHVRSVRWGHKLVSVAAGCLEFANGTSVSADLVVGADGAWSRVRTVVSDATPVYSGVTHVEVRFDDVDRRHPEIAELVGPGHMFANNGAGRAIILQRNSNGHIRGYIGLRVGLGEPIDLRTAFDDWAEPFQRVIREGSAFINRPLHVLPAPLTWPHTPGVTLLGDAAHLMSPFGGNGANLAMLDGAELGRAIAEERDLDVAIRRYEKDMLPRSGELAVAANQALDRFYSTGSHIPDHQLEHDRYRAAAAEYRSRQSS
ncbi:NAD(P)/FAD-dependent oxidoreductase [Kutzneria buriramensis]|uniref:Flavin-dependent monooxygenase n=1 Tax=Kutzneria buriramensis TaxID=1045776 RepID=A0A3E0HFV9_9PSEU|nr:NAD(P)/FAD-dependent oxidoreductase [Kutzneria buriramensis]REH43685.1 2-polyprenyl-6-methoxyphenol hydroxylase-like FAD-dependent oxidoreductase [Kutzneria buriramensis]